MQYPMQKFEETYREALICKASGDYAGAASLLKEAAYYLGKAEECGAVKSEKNAERIERLRAMADELLKRAQSQTIAQPASAAPQKKSEEEMQSLFELINAEDISVSMDDVIGLHSAKRAIEEYVINPKLHPEAYTYNFIPSKAILLEGPPGTGKTMFAKAVAREINQPFALIKLSSLVSKYVGDTSKNIDSVFAYLREYTKTAGTGITVFFDEFDEIAKRRDGEDKASASAVPALLRNLDGMIANENFLILANINYRDVIDPAILSRFRKIIHIELPDKNAREKLFRSKLRDIEPELTDELAFPAAAEKAENLSGRDITFICDDFKYILAEIKSGIAKKRDLNQILGELIIERKYSAAK